MRVVGYTRASMDAPLARVRTIDEQRAAIDRWAGRHHAVVVVVAEDVGRTATGGLGTRAGLAQAFGALRDGAADALVVASLDRLSADVIEQELLRAELIRRGHRLRSARPADGPALSERCDEERALIRRVIEASASFGMAMRDLHVLHRIRTRAEGTDAELAVMARIEQLAEHGASLRDITGSLGGRRAIGSRLRSLRARAVPSTKPTTTPN